MPSASNESVRILRREPIFRGFFRLDRYRFRHRLYAGGWSKPITREVYERGRAVTLLLYDPQRDKVVLVEQFRLAAHLAGFPGWQIEVVAGIVDDASHADTDVARREAKEETGLTIEGELIPVQRILTSPGGTTESVNMFCARVDSHKAGGVHGLVAEGEDIKVLVKSYTEAMRLVRRNEISNSPTVVALYWLMANRAKLRRRWSQVRRKPRVATKSSLV